MRQKESRKKNCKEGSKEKNSKKEITSMYSKIKKTAFEISEAVFVLKACFA
jgi:hypothetical protein